MGILTERYCRDINTCALMIKLEAENRCRAALQKPGRQIGTSAQVCGAMPRST